MEQCLARDARYVISRKRPFILNWKLALSAYIAPLTGNQERLINDLVIVKQLLLIQPSAVILKKQSNLKMKLNY